MIEALLHGKLSREQENMEDILTSNVFGLFQYVAPEAGLFRFLARAITSEGVRPLESLLDRQMLGADVRYSFWPKWAGCEPDVVLHIQGSDWSHLVGTEAKYLSGKSSEAEEAEEETEEQLETECTDQLIREWNDLAKEAEQRLARPVLIYLTADVGCPKEQIQDSLKEYRRNSPARSPEPLICWLSWRELPELFACQAERPLADIARLAGRLGLVFFQGLASVPPVRADWVFQAMPTGWNFQFPHITNQWRFSQ